MPTPPKPVSVLKSEKRSHRTRKELDKRGKTEASLLSTKPLSERPEVKTNPVAHKEFMRLKGLFCAIEKADALYTSVINRYCLLYAECLEHETMRAEFAKGMDELKAEYRSQDFANEDLEMKPSTYYKLLRDMQQNITTLDRLALEKRKMMLAIEKECIMTIAAALRSVPKKPEEEDQEDPMLQLLNGRGSQRA